jgi:hypothetical protein
MALKGRLEDFGITQLMNLINLARKTGTLYLEGQDKVAHLSFREGKLIYAAMDGVDDYLPVVLHRAGVFTSEHVDMIRTHMPGKSDQDIAKVLITSGRLQQQVVLKHIRDHILGVVYQVFSLDHGRFRFESNSLPIRNRITVSIALENVIMEGSRRLKEWELLQDELPNLDISLKFAERPTTPLRDINLSVEEWRVISFINPRNSIRRIAHYNNMDELQIRKIVYSLLQAGLVEMVYPQRSVSVTSQTKTGEAGVQQPTPQMRRPAVKRGIIKKLIQRIREL